LYLDSLAVTTLHKDSFMLAEANENFDPLGYFQGNYQKGDDIVGSGTGGDPWLKANTHLLKFLQAFKKEYIK